MKWLLRIVFVVTAVWLALNILFPDSLVRYRLTIEVETPTGVRSGSSVIEVNRIDNGWSPLPGQRYNFHVKGEAVFIDLDAGKPLVALLAFGPKGEDVDSIRTVWYEAAGYYASNADVWTGARKIDGPINLTGHFIPTLATFTNLNDPSSARAVDPREFEKIFGPGYRFRRAYTEVVSSGVWPLSLIPIPFFPSLFGTPVTRGIEAKMPLLVVHRERLRTQRTAPSDPYIPQFHQYFRG